MNQKRATYGEPLRWAKAAAVSETDECLLWPFSVTAKGYGSVRWGRRTMHAHRAVCILAHGDPPSAEHTEVAHSCGQRRCCNPGHVRHATSFQNASDAQKHGTTAVGEKSGRAKLIEADVVAIRAACDAGANQSELARRYGVTPKAINFIARRINWSRLAEATP